MHKHNIDPWRHQHSFGQEKVREGERKTLIVITITAVMMVVEIAAGIAFGSMALLADGLHMASHTAAIGIAAFAYIYARRRAFDERFSFGTGKVNSLAGFASAVLLIVFALLMVGESTERFFNPVAIAFDQAILVAVLGLVVNGVSAVVLGHSGSAQGHDHNLRAAYFHVLADALTSVLAIIALVAGKFYGLNWLDPAMGIVGALLVARWSMSLIRSTSQILLDHQAPDSLRERIRTAIENCDMARVSDLHVWSIGPNVYAAEIAIVSDTPREPSFYRNLLPTDTGLAHVTVEVQRCEHSVDFSIGNRP